MSILEVEDLVIKVAGKVILDGITFKLQEHENYILFGPNGSGKTALISAILGLQPFEVVSGKIVFMGEDLTAKNTEERAKLGISIGFQNPPEIMGVTLSQLLNLCLNKDTFSSNEDKLIDTFNLRAFLNRDINVGFSGGERKRAEILQMILLKSKLLLLDEPDSGVDIESLKVIAREIQRYIEESKSSALIITHNGDILEYIKANYACVLIDGTINCFANPKLIYENIKRDGYKECISCQKRVEERW